MKGRNTLHLGQAAMVGALQVWADGAFTRPPKVLRVRTALTSTSLSEAFDVDVEEQDEVESGKDEPSSNGPRFGAAGDCELHSALELVAAEPKEPA